MWIVLVALLAQSVDFQTGGIKALDAGEYNAAVDLFTKAVAADPKDYAPHFHLALAYSLLGKNAEAILEYRIVLDLKPALYEAETNLGICLLRVKDSAAAIPYLKSAAAQKPKEFQPISYLARAFSDQQQWPEAEAAYATSLSLNSVSAPSEAGLGEALARQGKLADAQPHYRKAVELDPVYRDSLLQLAQFFEDHRQPLEAIALYRGFPENPGAQERMGNLLLDQGRAADAIAPLESAVAKAPTTANRVTLAQAYVATKQLDKATPLAAQAVAAEPKDFQLRMFYGHVLRDQHQYLDAAPQFLAATQLQPDSVPAWNELAGALILGEQYPQGIAALDRIHALGAETPGHFYFRALAFDHLHQPKDALANYNKFLETSQGKNADEEILARMRVKTLEKELGKR